MVSRRGKVEESLYSFGPNVFRAAVENDPVEMGLALSAGQKLDDIQPGTGFTPIHVACIRRSTAFLAEALKHQFDPWVRDTNQRLPIDHAFAHGLKDAHRDLLAKMYPPGWADIPSHPSI